MSEQKINYPFQVVAEIVKGIAWPIAALIIFFYLKLPIISFISTLSHKEVAPKEQARVEVKNVFMEKEWTHIQKRNPNLIPVSHKVPFRKLKTAPANKEKLNDEFGILSKKLDLLTKKVEGIQKTLPKKIVKQKQVKVVHKAAISSCVPNSCSSLNKTTEHTKTIHLVKHSS
jgi:hypothetical protein